MLKPYLQRSIKFATIEEPSRTVVYAALVETNGIESKIIYEPQIVRIIVKNSIPATLAAAPKITFAEVLPIISPFSQLFVWEDEFVITLSARAPTSN